LTTLVSGDLDWIVMKALEKDRSRRYETPVGLIEDLQRYLADQPVQARPPSAAYRFHKFVRRNKVALTVAAVVLIVLSLLAGSLGWTMHERSARQSKVSGQLELILDEVAKLEQAEKWPQALASARRAEPVLAEGEAAPDIELRARHLLADLRLVQRVEEIRALSGTPWADRQNLTDLAARADLDYASAFRDAGSDIDRLSVQAAVDRIKACGPIATALLPAFDDWVAVRSLGNDQAATQRLVDLLGVADSDTWRREVRV